MDNRFDSKQGEIQKQIKNIEDLFRQFHEKIITPIIKDKNLDEIAAGTIGEILKSPHLLTIARTDPHILRKIWNFLDLFPILNEPDFTFTIQGVRIYCSMTGWKHSYGNFREFLNWLCDLKLLDREKVGTEFVYRTLS